MPTNDYITFAHQLADAAGTAIRPYFGAHGQVTVKGDQSPVTIADRDAEAAIRARIERHYPDHGIYGEEQGEQGLDKKYVWVIDPIDGTRAFIAGKKEWGTLIALCEDGLPILGLLDQPMTGERWLGIKGQPTLLNGSPIRASRCSALAQARISATYCAPPDDTRYERLAARCSETLTGGDCYAYGMLARGERDIVCDTALKPYDILALVPLIEGAGGIITDWSGAPVRMGNTREALAASSGIHADALRALR